jgi:hypothetical protein
MIVIHDDLTTHSGGKHMTHNIPKINIVKANDTDNETTCTININERITYWIELLEEQAEDLLEERVSDEDDQLSAKDRLTLGTRYIALLQRFLQLAQRVEATTPNDSMQATLKEIAERMRGDWPLC